MLKPLQKMYLLQITMYFNLFLKIRKYNFYFLLLQ